MRYTIGHPAYPEDSSNRYTIVNTIQGVYVELVDRGVSAIEAKRACRDLQNGSFVTCWCDPMTHNVVEAQAIHY